MEGSVKILVTGGSGFIGSALVKGLVAEGHHVRVLDDNSRGRPRRLASVERDIELVDGDVRDPVVVDRATEGMEAVAHLAFVNGTQFFYEKPKLVLEVGVKGALNTLEAAIRHGVKRYWYTSSSEVYQTPPSVPTAEHAPMCIPDPLNPRYSYAGGKLISELLAINYGREAFDQTVIVRPHNVYGPDMGWEHVIPQMALRAKTLSEQQPDGPLRFPIQGDGSQSRAFVYIDDFVRGCMAAFLRGEDQQIYHVGTNDERTIHELAELVVHEVGRAVEIVAGDLPPGGTLRRCPGIRKVAALGYAPEVSLEEGVATTVAWYLENAGLQHA